MREWISPELKDLDLKQTCEDQQCPHVNEPVPNSLTFMYLGELIDCYHWSDELQGCTNSYWGLGCLPWPCPQAKPQDSK